MNTVLLYFRVKNMASTTTITISPPSAQGPKKSEPKKEEGSKEKLMVCIPNVSDTFVKVYLL